MDYFAGTIGGVVWGACVAILVPHSTEGSLLLVLFLALAPLAYVAALYPWLSVGPITAAIVVLLPEMLHNSPINSATARVSEVLLGGLAGLFVSFVLPWSASPAHPRTGFAVAGTHGQCCSRAGCGL